jgi:hypothetical protein
VLCFSYPGYVVLGFARHYLLYSLSPNRNPINI